MGFSQQMGALEKNLKPKSFSAWEPQSSPWPAGFRVRGQGANPLLTRAVIGDTMSKEMGWEEQRHGAPCPCKGTEFLESRFSD